MIFTGSSFMPKMFNIVCLAFFLAALRTTASLSCYTCSDVDSLENCQSNMTCGSGQSCFTRSETIGQNQTFTMGCTDDENCDNIPPTLSAEQCYECCGTEKCNDLLCQQETPVPCVDTYKNCEMLDYLFDVCDDIHDAKFVCRKSCDLCLLVDGNWADWSSWSSCNVTCGPGKHTRTRTCTNPAPAYWGLDCEGNDTDTKQCFRPLCPEHGGWTNWTDWGTCSVTCGIGVQKRHRTCTNPSPLRYGDHCFGDTMDVNICVKDPCEAVDGGWTEWGGWGYCSASCDWGLRKRSRSCTNPCPDPYGKYCDGDSSDVEICYRKACHTVPDTGVAFNAYNITDITPTPGQSFVFSNALVNEGGAYNCSSGIFVAPRSGLYIFNAQICTEAMRNFQLHIMVGNVSYASVYGYTRSGCDCPFTQAVTKLEKNQQVSVKSVEWFGKMCVGRFYKNFFSWFLVHE